MANRLRRVFDELRYKSTERGSTPGRMGKPNADGTYTTRVEKRPGYAYVRLGAHGDRGVTLALNLGEPYQDDRPVKMVRMTELGDYIIIGSNPQMIEAFANGSLDLDVVSSHTHQIGTGLSYELEALRLAPGRPVWNSGMTVYIGPFRYYYAGVWRTWLGGVIDLTSYKPSTSDYWAWVMFGINPATNVPVAVTGDEYPITAVLTADLLDNIDFSFYLPSGAVKVREDDTTLSNTADYQDASGWKNQHVDELGNIPDVDLVTDPPTPGQTIIWNGYKSSWETSFTWDDLTVPLSAVNRQGLTAPDWVKFMDDGAGSTGVWGPQFDKALEEEVSFDKQVTHDYEEGTSLLPHVHWSPTDTDTGDVVWGLEYTWANIGEAYGNTTIITKAFTASGTNKFHEMSHLPAIDGTGKGHSSMIRCRLFRDAGDTADTYDADAAAAEVDFHYIRNTTGDYDSPIWVLGYSRLGGGTRLG